MAIHASGGRRNIRVPGLFDSIVAIAAIDPQLVRMHRMGKTDRLNGLVPDAGIFRREIIPHACGDSGPSRQRADNDFRGELVRPLWKNVGHYDLIELPALPVTGAICSPPRQSAITNFSDLSRYFPLIPRGTS